MDLSKVLGDVYDADEAAAPLAPVAASPQGDAPEWADEARLDRAFASWTPGPPADAPAAEREMAADIGPARARLDELVAATVTPLPPPPAPAAAPAYAPAPAPAPAAVQTYAAPPAPTYAPEPLYVTNRQWVRGDDDVVTGTARGRRRR